MYVHMRILRLIHVCINQIEYLSYVLVNICVPTYKKYRYNVLSPIWFLMLKTLWIIRYRMCFWTHLWFIKNLHESLPCQEHVFELLVMKYFWAKSFNLFEQSYINANWTVVGMFACIFINPETICAIAISIQPIYKFMINWTRLRFWSGICKIIKLPGIFTYL